MFNVMVVEDSKPIVRNIKRQIEAADSRLNVTRVAYNGAEALAILKQERVDIVFTDIRMPKMDGLSFVQEAKQIQPGVKFFILSGFNDFEYARKAIKLEVCEYLLKPLDPLELSSALERTVNELERARRVELEKRVARLLSFMGSDTESELPIQGKTYSIAVVRNGYFKTGGQTVDRGVLYNLCQETFPEANCIVTDTPAEAEKAIVFGWNEDVPEIAERMQAFHQKLKAIYPLVNIAYSPAETAPGRIKSLFQSLTGHLNKCIELGQPQVLGPSTQHAETGSFEPDSFEELAKMKCHALIRHGRKEALREELDKLITHWETARVPVSRIRALLAAITEPFEASVQPEAIDELIAQCGSYSDLRDQCLKKLSPIIDQLDRKPGSKMDTMEIIDAFFAANLYRQVSMQDLCRELNYSATYIIRIVKEFRGMTPVEYFNKLKIDEAKAIMDTSENMLVKDIAEALGFSDQHYFCKVFKQYTGYSPSEYKKRAQCS
ncbi:response regulator transcription factor [Cohnella laeviribosi]|uniref:response regulator transcription factor n=1 Tax=Cohnella laeviribosi TaxID=380174 RepID=UPI00035F3B98|nr:response regulator [Cohnella laeviribosi]